MAKRIRTTLTVLAVASAVGAVAIVSSTGTAGAHERWAKASLRTADGTRVGTVAFADERHGDETEVTVELRNAEAVEAFHGLHIHANDDPANGSGCTADPAQASTTRFVSSDGHWKHDPTELHGHHAGDLPSVFVNADGTATMRFEVDKLRPSEVIGRAVVMHAGPDNFGNVPVGANADQYTPGSAAVAKTQGTGNAGDRFACGVIKRH
jgi:Cu-Zn family superoxide dismutase